jgi:hypothetical protein
MWCLTSTIRLGFRETFSASAGTAKETCVLKEALAELSEVLAKKTHNGLQKCNFAQRHPHLSPGIPQISCPNGLNLEIGPTIDDRRPLMSLFLSPDESRCGLSPLFKPHYVLGFIDSVSSDRQFACVRPAMFLLPFISPVEWCKLTEDSIPRESQPTRLSAVWGQVRKKRNIGQQSIREALSEYIF